jgi:predicted metal-dependent TIM-barrel fold hydrolase
MRIIDPGTDITSLNRHNLEEMALAGIIGLVATLGTPVRTKAMSAQTLLEFYETQIDFQHRRTREYLIDTYVAVGIHPFFVPSDWEKVFKELPKYLKEKRVVAFGETGLDPRSPVPMATQEEIFKIELRMAKEHNKVVIAHLPQQWQKEHTAIADSGVALAPSEQQQWIKKLLELMDDAKFNPGHLVIEHANAPVVKMITDSGCNACISVQPWRNITPKDAARMLQTADLNRTLINSDCGIWLPSDPLSIPKTVLEMRLLNFSDDDIERLVYKNPIRLFNMALPNSHATDS